MTQILRQSTAVNVHIGPAVAVGDGFTPVTTLSLSTADEAEALLAGATSTTSISGLTFTAITGADGWYYLSLTATETATCGTLTILINDDSLILPIFARFQVVEENVYDMIYASGGDLGTTVDAILTDTAEIGAAGAGLTEAGGTGDHLTAIDLPDQTMNITGNITGNLSGSVGSVTGAVGSVTGAVGSVTGNVGGNVTGSVGSVLGGINTTAGVITTLDGLDTAQDAQHAQTQADIAALNDLSAAQVNAEVDTALVDINLDHLVKIAVDTNFATTVHLDSVIGQIADVGTTATFDRTTDSLEGVRNHIGDGTNLTEAGGTGDHLTAIDLPDQTMNITGNITGNLSGSVGSVTGAVGSVTGAVGSVTGNVGGNVVGSVASVTGAINTAAGTITTLDALDTAQDTQHAQTQSDISGLNNISVSDILTTQMTESYAANGTAPTLAQCQFAIHQMLMQFGISSTSLTVKKLDNSTTAFVVTLDDATNPTSAERQ